MFTTFCNGLKEIEIAKDSGFEEAIISHINFSRLGKGSSKEVNKLLQAARDLKMKTIFEWDCLLTQKDFDKLLPKLKEINFDLVDSIRVQDPGVLEYVLENYSQSVQLVCEVGSTNLCALENWESYIGARLERLIISAQLQKETITYFARNLKTPLEILVLGPILLFYTPRNLLSAFSEDDHIDVLGSSEESPHKGFPITQNTHGTFMFHIKNQFLLDYKNELLEMGIKYLRVDLRDSNFRLLENLNNENFLSDYNKPVVKGFYRANKTDVLFPKLKNHRLQNRDKSFIGEVVDVIKDEFLVIDLKENGPGLKKGQQIKFLSTQGKEISYEVAGLKDSNLGVCEQMNSGLALIKYKSALTAKSMVFNIIAD